MDLITQVEKQRGKMRVVVNDETTIMVPISLFRERPLQEGDEIELAEYDNWLMIRQYRHALDRAVVFLTARARSNKEV
ncbi:MAG: MoaD/ThiS family protein, partial [Clostridia bacterium]|nr:MoaD/ThiS family protein [Clostridia bacterium]